MDSRFGQTKIEREYASRRRRALQIMKKFGATSDEELVVVLFDRNQPIFKRQQACRALGYLATSRAEEALVQIVEKSAILRRPAWKGLMDIEWKKSYVDIREKNKADAFLLMAELSVQSVEQLSKILLNSATPSDQRRKACLALGYLGLVSGLPAVLRAFRDDDLHLVSAASNAVIAIGSRRATSRLLTIIDREKNIVARQCAIYALTFLKDIRAKRSLIRVLNDQNETPYTRGLAAEALAATSEARDAIDALIRATQDPSVYVRYTAVNTINTEDPRARKAVRERLTDAETLDARGTVGQLARRVLDQYKKASVDRRSPDSNG